VMSGTREEGKGHRDNHDGSSPLVSTRGFKAYIFLVRDRGEMRGNTNGREDSETPPCGAASDTETVSFRILLIVIVSHDVDVNSGFAKKCFVSKKSWMWLMA